jgi:hypothetical protein
VSKTIPAHPIGRTFVLSRAVSKKWNGNLDGAKRGGASKHNSSPAHLAPRWDMLHYSALREKLMHWLRLHQLTWLVEVVHDHGFGIDAEGVVD